MATNPLNLPTPVDPTDVFGINQRTSSLTKNEIQKQKCESYGGQWDEVSQKCIYPNEDDRDAPLETFTDPKTGRASGITTPDGKTYLGLTASEVNKIAGAEQERAARPEGTAPVGTAAALQADIQRKINIAKQIGTIDYATAQQIEEQEIDKSQALAAGVQDIIPSALAFGAGGLALGGVAGAGVGSTVSAPVGAGLGFGVGAIKGFYQGITKNIKDQRTDLVSVKTKELKQRKTALNNYISAANANPAASDEMVQAFNVEKSLILRDYNTLIKRGNKDLNFWGSDATPQITDYEVFLESTLPSLEIRMDQAVLKPDPTRAYIDVGETE